MNTITIREIPPLPDTTVYHRAGLGLWYKTDENSHCKTKLGKDAKNKPRWLVDGPEEEFDPNEKVETLLPIN